ncbi:hypothetical protein DTO013E5_2735 [Penicillium roqueforti]|uniref:uncharacterized protein n=1 Tax=Penicillium roqueforti TaxID=5082 RepID=UPI00190E0B01|nr:uncharacterized protein LCP9604111_4603 [Penicillium roqueforti]KAF9249447.1 hypothetical protein LCP9604111_4603 [Penicillium roqueforti]KAI1834042.1 hypothetical protein CBS147337_5006 [Penicillium roqueforti]KAI2674832.1 hypothetical protein CBS147355_6646 [Penicillium roqueforti]KAI2687960.1 hypothetical protein LCP963914a_3478 [Penicillium roqueforti]KAI2727203.1 hypothetical protein CBS147354_3921 [Penicillium roqueforti]
MGVGDYVHSKEGGQAHGQATQSRQQRAEQARVEVPVTQLVDPGPSGANGRSGSLEFNGTSQFPNQSRNLSTHGIQRDRDVFDTDVEAIDDSTVAGTSVYGFDDNKSQAASSTNAAYTNPDPQSMYQPRPSIHTYGPNWYEGLGDQAMKKAGFDSDDFDDSESQMTSSLGGDGGDNEKSDEAHDWHASHKSRITEEPLSKRLENFWSASRKRTSSRQPVTIDSDPEPQTQPQPQPTSRPRKLGQMLPPTGPRKILLPHSSSAIPRTRFSPPKPSLLEQLDQQLDASPTRHDSQPPPDVGRTLSITSFHELTDSDGGSDDGMEHTIRPDERRESGGVSISAFDMTSLTDLDVDHTMQDPFFVHESRKLHEPSRRSRRNTAIHSKKRSLEADYPPEVLYQKSFSELQAEPFDKSPTPPPPVIKSPSLPPNPPSLVTDTEVPNNSVSHLLTLTDQERQTYLSHMTMDEWEDCGDQMIDRFTHLLSEMKNLRRARRRTAAVFEAEVKRRHDQVETQSLELTNKLTEMRTGGAEVLRGRHP